MTSSAKADGLSRREFLSLTGRRSIQIGLAGVSLPALLVACSSADDLLSAALGDGAQGKIVGDVIDYSLTGDWPGDFGSVTFRMTKAINEGRDVYLIRTDTSDETFAREEGLVWVPKIAQLVRGPHARAFLVDGGVADQPMVVSTQPGRDDFTPAWRLARARWRTAPRPLQGVKDIEAATRADELEIEETDVILNAPVVKWADGELPVDTDLTSYLGTGQLLEAPDPRTMTVTFKLHECFPGVRYIVTDTALAPMAAGMNVVHSPMLAGSTSAGATGRTNVFMNGVKGSGPMGFQPSVFDSKAGSAGWSPFWDHMTYAWVKPAAAKVLRDETTIRRLRDQGKLEEFPGTPDTGGATFVVNCPVPVIAPNSP